MQYQSLFLFFCISVFLSVCLFVFLSRYHSDQICKRYQVSKVTQVSALEGILERENTRESEHYRETTRENTRERTLERTLERTSHVRAHPRPLDSLTPCLICRPICQSKQYSYSTFNILHETLPCVFPLHFGS